MELPSPWSPTVHVGVMQIVLAFPGARSLKDRRGVLVSLKDRVKGRFPVSCHELEGFDTPSRAALVVTTAGSRRDVVESVLDSVRSFVLARGDYVVADIHLDVLPWSSADLAWGNDDD